jgi:hypothetical protein
MSFEQSIEKLTAAIEAATGVLVTSLGTRIAPPVTAPPGQQESKPNGAANGSAEPPKRGKGRPAATVTPIKAEESPDDDTLGGEDDDELGGMDDDELGSDDAPGVTVEEARTALMTFRDAAVKALGGKEEGLAATRVIMKKFIAKVDDLNSDNAAAVHKAFTEALPKLKKSGAK